jgi:hypothetical protein
MHNIAVRPIHHRDEASVCIQIKNIVNIHMHHAIYFYVSNVSTNRFNAKTKSITLASTAPGHVDLEKKRSRQCHCHQ